MSINPALIMPESGSVNDNSPVGTLSGHESAYWKTPATHPNQAGFVTTLPIGANAVERFFNGWITLQPQYGAFNMAQGADGWSVKDDPYLRIIQRGGLKEFPAQQVVNLNWHRRPGRLSKRSHKLIWERIDALIGQGASETEAILAAIPQLREEQLQSWGCEFCPDRVFNEEIHLKRHESVMHADDVRSRETREGLKMALREGAGVGGGQLPEMLITALASIAKDSKETQAALLSFLRANQVAVPFTPGEVADATGEAAPTQPEPSVPEETPETRGQKAFRLAKEMREMPKAAQPET